MLGDVKNGDISHDPWASNTPRWGCWSQDALWARPVGHLLEQYLHRIPGVRFRGFPGRSPWGYRGNQHISTISNLGNSVALVPENLDHLGDPPNILRLILILRQSQIWNSKKRTKKDVGIDGIDCTRPAVTLGSAGETM